jgi:hypothetical protein
MIEEYKANAARLLTNPDDPVSLVNHFVMLAGTKRVQPSHLPLVRRAAELAPDAFEAVFNLASALNLAGQYKEAMATYQRSLAICPENRKADVLYNIGMCFHDLGDMDKAINWYDKALKIRSDLDVWQARAVARLTQGHLAEGLFDFEVQWHRPSRKKLAASGIPRWRGESLEGKRIIVGHEQGYGDTLQFIRFLPRLKAKHIAVSAPPELQKLVVENFDIQEWLDEEGPFDADYYCSPISAAGALGIEYKDVSGLPYLKSEPMKLPKRGKLNVGLSWKGSPGYARDAHRSMNLETLCPLLDLPGAAFYSLQIRPGPQEVSNLGLDGFIGDLGSLINTWKDTARAIMAMDVVVSTDTANAHLAGALGKPVLLMLPYASCWRWMTGKTTPWYDSMRLFRQNKPCDWSWPVKQVRSALKEML